MLGLGRVAGDQLPVLHSPCESRAWHAMGHGNGTGPKGKAFALSPGTGMTLILQTGPSPSLLSLGRFKPLFCT